MLRISYRDSVRRIARLLVDKGDQKRKEILSTLDTDSRIAVIENMIQIKKDRKSG